LGRLGFLRGSSDGGERSSPLPRGLGKKTLGRFERHSRPPTKGRNACEGSAATQGDSGRSSQAQTQKQTMELLLLRLNATTAYMARRQLGDC